MPAKSKTLRVKARDGIRVPIEGAPRTHITDADAVVVPNSVYYRRQLRDGDLVGVAEDGRSPAPARPRRRKPRGGDA